MCEAEQHHINNTTCMTSSVVLPTVVIPQVTVSSVSSPTTTLTVSSSSSAVSSVSTIVTTSPLPGNNTTVGVGTPGIVDKIKESEDKYKQQYLDSQQREKILVRRLAAKEQEIQDYVAQITELKSAQVNSTPGSVRSCMLDPAINILVTRLKQELTRTRTHLEETQNEFSAWKFTPDSNTGKKLMAKCRLLHQENEDLGKMATSGRIAKLEGDLALQKNFSEEAKKSQSELDDFLQELDEDVEGMQSTIVLLQQELRVAREKIESLTQEISTLRSKGQPALTNGSGRGEEYDSESEVVLKDRLCVDDDSIENRTQSENDNIKCYNAINGKEENSNKQKAIRTNNCEPGLENNKRSYGSDSSECSLGDNGHAKKQRRGSVLSLDYNEDEEPLTTASNGDAN